MQYYKFEPDNAVSTGALLVHLVRGRELNESVFRKELNFTDKERKRFILGSIPLSNELAKKIADKTKVPISFWKKAEKLTGSADVFLKRRISSK